MVLVSLLTCFTKAKADDYEFVNYQIEKNGVIYSLFGEYSDGVDGKNTTYAVVSAITDNFVVTSLVVEATVQAEMKSKYSSDISITINVPVKDIEFSNYVTQVTSLTLPTSITEDIIPKYNRYDRLYYLENLEEIIVEEGNERYSSNHGLLCNSAGDSLLYIPKKSCQIIDGILTVPVGIHYDAAIKDSYFDDNQGEWVSYYTRICYQDELYAWPKYNSLEMWFEKNQTPPEGENRNAEILHIPEGCMSAYSGKVGADFILEIGGNVDWVDTSYSGANETNAYYDVNDDGELEVLHSGNGMYRIMKRDEIITKNTKFPNSPYSYYVTEIFQDPQKDDLVLSTNSNIFRIEEEEIYIYGGKYIDVDGDGLRDLACVPDYEEDWVIYKQQPDGSLIETAQHSTIIKPSDATSSSSRLPSLRDGMFLSDGPVSSSGGVIIGEDFRKDVDLNNDGLVDFLSEKGIHYSNGENQYTKLYTETSVWTYDIDGDGDMDMVTFSDGVVKLITQRSSNAPVETELFRNSGAGNPIFRDFDKDGDIDILFSYSIQGDYNYTTHNYDYTSYFIFLRNNGNGTFRKKESNFSNNYYTLQACGDYDSDGLYELLVYDKEGKGKMLKVNSNLTITDYPEEFILNGKWAYYWKLPTLGDFNNDGLTEWYSNNGAGYGHLKTQTIRNTAPQKMAMPLAVLQPENNRLKITWKQGKDKETSACDLTYELRIGTAPGKGDVMRPASLEDGRRKTLREGEMGTALYKLFNANALKPGTYYIAVQAIDAGGLGGAFSDEFVYEHKPSAPSFSANMSSLSTGDTLIVNLMAPIITATYEWTLSEGEILKQNEKGAEIQFHEMGEHTVALTMILDGIAYKSEPKVFYVDAAKSDIYIRGSVFDINQDGYADALYHTSRLYPGGWKDPLVAFQNDGNGNLSEVKLSVFSDLLDASVLYVTDYDRDGYPDMIMNGTNKGNLFLNYGEQDFDFDYKTIDFKYNIITPHINLTKIKYVIDCTDLNNDGHTDIIAGNSLYNLGDDITYDELELPSGAYVNYTFYDINRDGFLDIVKYDYDETQSISSWTVYYKDNTEQPTYTNEQTLFRVSGHISGDQLADLNSDGVVDLIYYNYRENALYVIKGIKEHMAVETIKIPLPFEMGSSEVLKLRDINNDGFLDICLRSIIILVKQNFTFEVVETKTAGYYRESTWIVFKDGGYPGGMTGTIRNAKPSAPATVAAKQTADGLLITWADAADDHTPAMQMRYNVSVKRKGMTGPGAYIISPMNGESDVATIVSNYLYKQSTQMLVPASVLTVGETYEIRVQAIDLWNEVSPMTKAIDFTMGGDGYISVPEQVTMNSEVTVKYMGAKMSKYSINVGAGGKVVKNLGNGQYIVTWSSEGVKQISITAGSKTVKSSVTVVKSIDLTLDLPDVIYVGTQTPIRFSDSFAENAGTGSLRICSRKYLGYIDPLTDEEGYVETELDIEYNQESKVAYVTFPKAGKYYFEVTSNDPVRGGSNKFEKEVTSVMPEAKIARVDIDGQTNRYTINWNTSSLPEDIVKVVILKEGKSLNQFNALDTVAVGKGRYVDMSSNPAVMSARYQIKLVSSNGQVSEPSVAHRPLHVMLTTAPGGYNLIWDRYEGIEVDNYKIFRGSSPDNLTLLKQVAGSLRSYTDKKPINGVNYYSIVFTPVNAASRAEVRRTIPNGDISSNVMSSENAIDAILAESIEIMMADENAKLCKDTPELQLYSILKPAYCTINEVEWNIVEGEDLATIDDDGILKIANGDCSGTVVVQARTIDGSNLSTSQSVTVEAMSASVGDANGDGKVDANDIEDIVNQTMGKPTSTGKFSETNADANEDGIVNIADIVKIVNIIMRGGDNN